MAPIVNAYFVFHVLVTVMILGKPELVRRRQRASQGEFEVVVGGINTVIVMGRAKAEVVADVVKRAWSCNNES